METSLISIVENSFLFLIKPICKFFFSFFFVPSSWSVVQSFLSYVCNLLLKKGSQNELCVPQNFWHSFFIMYNFNSFISRLKFMLSGNGWEKNTHQKYVSEAVIWRDFMEFRHEKLIKGPFWLLTWLVAPGRVLNFISYICCAFLFCLSVIFNGFYGWVWAFTYNVIPMIHRQCLHTTAILAAIRKNFKCQNACTLHTVHTYTSEYSVGLEKLYAETDETKALFSH